MPDSSKNGQKLKKNGLEWTVFAVSLALVLAVVGYLAYAAFTVTDEPPSFSIEWDAPEARDGGYVLPLHIHNEGPTTAANVQVEVTSGEETVTFTLVYLPRHSTREGVAFFEAFPLQPRARVLAYERP